VSIPWEQLYPHHTPRRISLPTYPFAKERYWLSRPAKTALDNLAVKDDTGTSPDSLTTSAYTSAPDLAETSQQARLLTLQPTWEPTQPPLGAPWPSSSENVLIVGGDDGDRRSLRALYPRAHVIDIAPETTTANLAHVLQGYGRLDHIFLPPLRCSSVALTDEALLQRQHAAVLSCFRLVRALILQDHSPELGWTLLTAQALASQPHEEVDPAQAGLHGLMGSLAKECPSWKIRSLDLPAREPWDWDELIRVRPNARGDSLLYRRKEWHRETLLRTIIAPSTQPQLREGGVYVVVGGAGGVGEFLSEYLIERYQAQLYWLGRRECDAVIQAKIDRLSSKGPRPEYLSVDASDREALERALHHIKQRHARVNGVVHAALVMTGVALSHVDEHRFELALRAKADVSVRIAQVFEREPLDWLVFFSSIEAFQRSPRHAGYAAGVAFADAYAHQLARRHSGHVKILNWGYWRSSMGVTTPSSVRHWLDQAGLDLIQTPEGMDCLERALAAPFVQLACVKATRPDALSPLISDEVLSLAPASAPQVLAGRTVARSDLACNDAAHELRSLEPLLIDLLVAQLYPPDPTNSVAAKGSSASSATQRWLDETQNILIDHARIRVHPGGSVVAQPARDPQGVWAQWEIVKERSRNGSSSMGAAIALLDTMLRALPEIVRGRRRATDYMFPQSSLRLIEGIYRGNPVADFFNEVLAAALAEYVDARLLHDPSTRIRILEIGAGTGATSAAAFKMLDSRRSAVHEYCYTDVSNSFLWRAQEEFARDRPYLRCTHLDVETPLADQGIELGSYDIVIAANVLHATRNIRRTLRHAKTALKANGLLLLNEISRPSIFSHLTFGLLDGWWLFEDASVRMRGTPALDPSNWRRALEEEGFFAVEFPACASHEAGQQIIAAHSDGWICRHAEEPGIEVASREQGDSIGRAAGAELVTPRAAPAGDDRQADLVAIVRDSIIAIVARALKLNPKRVVTDQSFADYGLDSIIGVIAVDRINEALGIRLTSTTLFDYSTVDKLTTHIVSAYGDSLASYTRAASPSATPSAAAPERSSLPLEASSAKAECEISEREVGGESHEPIAIIGMSGRFAHADSPEELWEYLADGRDLIQDVQRWDVSHLSGKDGERPCTRGGFLRSIDHFDPQFFSISGAEADYIDPQQRLFLQQAWAAIEDAGYAGDSLNASRCGVYVGYNGSDYPTLIGEQAPPQAMWGNAASVVSARIAYYLNLQGPAITVDTACSSSLVAIHLACQGLWSGETDIALAGGVFVQSTPSFYLSANRAGMLSPEGCCYTFDERANGFVPGEAVAAIVVKRLKDARADGDHIYAVIRGSAINQDGATNGITAPSALSQERLERSVYETFGIHPERIQMIEAHGTGTRLGDPIEVQALTNAFRSSTPKVGYCAIGSIKTNIGHATSASGIAGVVKVLLALKYRQIPASLNFEKGNPRIDFDRSPFFVNTRLREWTSASGTPRCAAVSSFGMSGTNAHVVVEEAPPLENEDMMDGDHLFVLSARTADQLRMQAERLLVHCDRHAALNPTAVSYTLLLGRRHCNHRWACVAASIDELRGEIQRWLSTGRADNVLTFAASGTDFKEQAALKGHGNQCIEECSDTCRGTARKERLLNVADLYVQGYRLDYARLFTSHHGQRRVPLPTYPFAAERYWVPGGATASTTSRSSAPVLTSWSSPRATTSSDCAPGSTRDPGPGREHEAMAEVLLFKEQWLHRELDTRQLIGTVRTIVCFLSGSLDREAASRTLSELSPQTRIVFVVQSERFKRQSAALYEVNASEPASYAQLFQAIHAEAGDIDAIFYLWPIEDRCELQHPTRVMLMLQACARVQAAGLRVLLAGHCATPLERCHLESWVGFERSVRIACPALTVAVFIGDEQPTSPALVSMWIKRLWQELRAERMESARYLQQRRQVLRATLHDAPAAGNQVLQQNGTYLITGGSGGLGLVFAEYLARSYRANLILIGRSPLSTELETRLRPLRQHGGKVIYLSIDVCDAEQLVRHVQHLSESLGHIHGVIHAAGVQAVDDLRSLSAVQFERVLAPKVTGSLAVERLCDVLSPAFLCYFSSASAVLGDFGSCDYAIANRFQMAHADYLSGKSASFAHPMKVVAINWPLWRDGGMRFESDWAANLYLQSSGLSALQNCQGLEVFEQLLSDEISHCLVLTGDAERIRKIMKVEPEQSTRSGVATVVLQADSPAAERTGRLRTLVLSDVTERLSMLLKLARGSLHASEQFAQFGFDSLSLAQFARELSNLYSVQLSPVVFFTHSTLEELVDYLVAEHSAAIAGFYGDISAADEVHGDSVETHTAKTTSEPGPLPPVSEDQAEPIAIIGMSGRYAGAPNLHQLWSNLHAGRDAITEVPADRWDISPYFEQEKGAAGKTYCKWGGFLVDADRTDPAFFDIAPSTVAHMDPQELLFLEAAWHALEDAGYTRESLQQTAKRSVGVYVGATYSSQLGHAMHDSSAEVNSLSLSSPGHIANRVSHHLQCRGPSIVVDTMCSSAASALHLACRALQAGDCAMALAGGVNLLSHPQRYVSLSELNALASDPACRSFCAGDGYLPSEGVGAVLLKPLRAAVRDRDRIHAIIRSTAANHCAGANRYLAPDPLTQAEVIRAALASAAIEPASCTYVEAAAVGSALGDAIEVEALSRVFRDGAIEPGSCAIGAVKSNIGHAEAASAMAQLAKVVLQLQHGELVPTVMPAPPNPNLNWKGTPFSLQRELRPWLRPRIQVAGIECDGPRRALLNSFGAGGSNVTLVVEEHLEECRRSPSSKPAEAQIVVFSARDQERLRVLLNEYCSYFVQRPETSLEDLAFTLQLGREAMESRLAFVASCMAQVQRGVEQYLSQGTPGSVQDSAVALYTGDLAEREGIRALLSVDAAQTLVQAVVAEGDLHKIAMLWVQGAKIDWSALHSGGDGRRIELPLYPFKRLPPANSATTGAMGLETSRKQGCDERESVVEALAQTFAGAVSMSRESIHAGRDLREYGLDSLAAIRFARAIGRSHNVVITARELLLEQCSLESLASKVLSRRAPLLLTQTAARSDQRSADARSALEGFRRGEVSMEALESMIEGGELR